MFVLRSNPKRFANQVFGFISLLVMGWLGSVALSIQALHPALDSSSSAVAWLRVNGVLTVILAWAVWLLNEAVLSDTGRKSDIYRRALPLFTLCLPLIVICSTDWYIPSTSVSGDDKRGGYFVCVAFGVIWHACLLLRVVRQMRQQTGIRRVEIQFLSFNLSLALLLVMLAIGFGNHIHATAVRQASVFIFLVAYFVAAWAITFHRIYTARQILLSFAQRTAVVAAIVCSAIALHIVLEPLVPARLGLLLSVALSVWTGLWLDRHLRFWLHLDGKLPLARLRADITTASRSEAKYDGIVMAFEKLLSQHFKARFAALLPEQGGKFAAGSMVIPAESAACSVLEGEDWLTPEVLLHRPASPRLQAAKDFLGAHDIGLLVAVPNDRSARLLVALGQKETGWPFTYPEVQRLQQAAMLIDGTLARARLLAEAELRTTAEHFSMMSRALAHDLKNLITPISSYLLHSDGRHPPGTHERRTHAEARHAVQILTDYIQYALVPHKKRDAKVECVSLETAWQAAIQAGRVEGGSVPTMTDYVREALFFSERMAPRFEPVDLRGLLKRVQEITADRVNRRSARLIMRCDHDGVILADGVLLQRVLGNLVNNAVDASNPGQEVTVSARKISCERLLLEVADQGCGIPAENLQRVFAPYFTTKEFGDAVRGFGVGLTISQKIVELHGGTIAIESTPGNGTVVRIELPCTQVPAIGNEQTGAQNA